jgi:hypothetical protein
MSDVIELVGGPNDGERRPAYEYKGQVWILRKPAIGEVAVYRRRAADVSRYDFNGYQTKETA